MRVTRIVSALAGIAALIPGQAAAAPRHDPLQQHTLNAAAGLRATAPAPQAGRHTRPLGALRLREGLHGDVWAHGNYAYVGTWSGPCPGTGVKVTDVSNVARPRLVGTLASYPNTSDEDMEVLSVSTPAFTGDLLAVGLQDCGLEGQAPGKTGVDLWDVTDPTHPGHLGFFETGSGGTHEVSLTTQVRDGRQRVLALAAVPFSELASDGAVGDFQLIDVGDPRAPVRTDDWGAGKDGHLPVGIAGAGLPAPSDCSPPPGAPDLCHGHFAAIFDHSASPSSDGISAYLAYWDAGAIILDISDPSDIRMIGRTVYPTDSEGDTHSAMPNAAGSVLVTTDEDFSPGETVAAGEPKEPGDTWGSARIWGIPNPTRPVVCV